MTEENHILFFDLEVRPKSEEIRNIGALLDGRPFIGRKTAEFESFATSARIVPPRHQPKKCKTGSPIETRGRCAILSRQGEDKPAGAAMREGTHANRGRGRP